MHLPITIRRMKEFITGVHKINASGVSQTFPSVRNADIYGMPEDLDVTEGAEFIDDGLRMKEQPMSFYKETTVASPLQETDPFGSPQAAIKALR